MPPKRAPTPLFADCVFAIAGTIPGHTQTDVNSTLTGEGSGATTAASITKKVTHLITTAAEVEKASAKVTKAQSMDQITLVTFDWVLESIKKKKLLDITPYKLGSTATSSSTSAATNTTPADASDKDDKNDKKTKASTKKRKASDDADDEDKVDKKIKVLADKVAKATNSPAKIKQPPVDRACGLPSIYSVYVDDDVAWNARLNQTNIGANNNKFYMIQLLATKAGQYAVFCHWGRVGAHGQTSTDMFGSLDSAKHGFERKFRDKTKNSWAARDNFVKQSGE
jgi:poly [ADP-ribose] polymerase